MTVDLFDGRVGRWRVRDVPTPLEPELTLTVWVSHAACRKQRPWLEAGMFVHTVWRQCGSGDQVWYQFIGTAPNADGPSAGRRRKDGSHADELSLPGFSTTPWPAPLHTAGIHAKAR